MIYTDLEKIYEERGIPNKYILTLVVAARARQLSTAKTGLLGNEKYITRAMDELKEGKLSYKIADPEPSKETNEEPDER